MLVSGRVSGSEACLEDDMVLHHISDLLYKPRLHDQSEEIW